MKRRSKILGQLEFKWTGWLRRAKAPKRAVAKVHRKGEDEQLSKWCREQVEQLSLTKLADKVGVSWNRRMSSTAGRVSWPECLIELNPRLKEISEEEMWRTLRHELAHLVAYARAGRRRIAPHGVEWRQACADLGIPGERTTHNLDLPSRSVKPKHLYVCRNCQIKWWRVRPFRRAVACYECCKTYNQGHYDERFRMVKTRFKD